MLPNDLFTHVNEPLWAAGREAYWIENNEFELKQDRFTKKQIAVLKAYYMTGDIEALFVGLKRMKGALDFYFVLNYAPFVKKAEFDYVVRYYCENYLPGKIEDGTQKLNNAQVEFKSYLTGLLCSLKDPFIGQSFLKEMTGLVFGNSYKPEVSYPEFFPLLGQPKIVINPNVLLQRLIPSVGGYLFDKYRHKQQRYQVKVVDYTLSLFSIAETAPFLLEKLNRNDVDEKHDYYPGLNQGTLRMFFANLYGYQHEYDEEEWYAEMDTEFQEELRIKIENLKLGPEFDAMIDMIHRHKGKVINVSE